MFIGELTDDRAVEMACTVFTELCVVSVISLAVVAEVQQRGTESEEKSQEAQRVAQEQREVRSSSSSHCSSASCSSMASDMAAEACFLAMPTALVLGLPSVLVLSSFRQQHRTCTT